MVVRVVRVVRGAVVITRPLMVTGVPAVMVGLGVRVAPVVRVVPVGRIPRPVVTVVVVVVRGLRVVVRRVRLVATVRP